MAFGLMGSGRRRPGGLLFRRLLLLLLVGVLGMHSGGDGNQEQRGDEIRTTSCRETDNHLCCLPAAIGRHGAPATF